MWKFILNHTILFWMVHVILFHFNLCGINLNLWRLNFWPSSFFLFRATPAAYGSSWARGQIRTAAASLPQPQQHWIQAASATYAAVCSNARSLTHWVRSGIKLHPQKDNHGSLTPWATTGTPDLNLFSIVHGGLRSYVVLSRHFKYPCPGDSEPLR